MITCVDVRNNVFCIYRINGIHFDHLTDCNIKNIETRADIVLRCKMSMSPIWIWNRSAFSYECLTYLFGENLCVCTNKRRDLLNYAIVFVVVLK